MKSKILVILAAAFLIACTQPAAKIEYVKYATEADVPRINVRDAKAAVDNGSAIIVDSRPEDAFKLEHIAGSINLPFGVNAEEKFSTLPQGKQIIVYCS